MCINSLSFNVLMPKNLRLRLPSVPRKKVRSLKFSLTQLIKPFADFWAMPPSRPSQSNGPKCGCNRWNRIATCYRTRVVSISGLTEVILNFPILKWSNASMVAEQWDSRCSFGLISFRSELQRTLALQSVTVGFIATMLNASMLLLLPAVNTSSKKSNWVNLRISMMLDLSARRLPHK